MEFFPDLYTCISMEQLFFFSSTRSVCKYVKALLGAYNRPLQINDFNHKYYIHNYSLIRIFTDYNCRYSQGMEKHARMKVKMVMPIMIHLKSCKPHPLPTFLNIYDLNRI